MLHNLSASSEISAKTTSLAPYPIIALAREINGSIAGTLFVLLHLHQSERQEANQGYHQWFQPLDDVCQISDTVSVVTQIGKGV